MRAAWFAVALVVLTDSSCTLGRIVWRNTSTIYNYKIFPSRELHKSDAPFRFTDKTAENRISQEFEFDGRKYALDDFLKNNDSVAFIVIKNDEALYEKYFNGHDRESVSLAFSSTKSFLSLLVGIAVDEGYIKSVKQKATDFIPELKGAGFDKVELEHLLNMTAGTNYSGCNALWCDEPYLYYGEDMEKSLLQSKVVKTPGSEYEYKSGETQLLAIALARAIAPTTLTEYMQKKVWTPLGMEYDAMWSLDREGGMEKAFCCVAGRAIDFAKIGRLYLNKGEWNGKKIVSREWVEKSTTVDSACKIEPEKSDIAKQAFGVSRSEGCAWFYRYQWWIVSKKRGDFMTTGHLGQHIYVRPDKGVIVVRLGKSLGSLNHGLWRRFYVELAERL